MAVVDGKRVLRLTSIPCRPAGRIRAGSARGREEGRRLQRPDRVRPGRLRVCGARHRSSEEVQL